MRFGASKKASKNAVEKAQTFKKTSNLRSVRFGTAKKASKNAVEKALTFKKQAIYGERASG